MANKYKGEVEFDDSTGQTFVVRLGTNDYLSNEKELSKLAGHGWSRKVLFTALKCGASAEGAAEAQKTITIEGAGDLLDDIGLPKFNEIYHQTKFGHTIKEANDYAKHQRDAALSVAVEVVAAKVESLRATISDDTDPIGLLDKILTAVRALTPKSEGSAPLAEATPPSN